MKSVTIREAQHELPRLLREVERGGSVQIRRRKNPVATLVPLASRDVADSWADHRERLQDLWKGSEVDVVDGVLADLRAED
jgi:antitoxin (DNA-binding transcriptional repressor) of toxin-antitoxin stability system